MAHALLCQPCLCAVRVPAAVIERLCGQAAGACSAECWWHVVVVGSPVAFGAARSGRHGAAGAGARRAGSSARGAAPRAVTPRPPPPRVPPRPRAPLWRPASGRTLGCMQRAFCRAGRAIGERSQRNVEMHARNRTTGACVWRVPPRNQCWRFPGAYVLALLLLPCPGRRYVVRLGLQCERGAGNGWKREPSVTHMRKSCAHR